jgi:alkylation response protein AidB-like acyl-CoA dehydrogenase
MPLLQSAEVSVEVKGRIADLVVRQGKLIAGNFSEPITTALIGERPLKARVSRAAGGYRINGRKMFASMLEAADFVLVMAYPEWETSPSAGVIIMLPRGVQGRSVDPNWDGSPRGRCHQQGAGGPHGRQGGTATGRPAHPG